MRKQKRFSSIAGTNAKIVPQPQEIFLGLLLTSKNFKIKKLVDS